MKSFHWFSLLVLVALITTPNKLFAQQSSTIDTLSESLMGQTIYSASKKDEAYFDAPLSSYVITRAEIENAGSTSIVEALRLAPGLIVREQTNGVYDVHVRGFDDVMGMQTFNSYTRSNPATLIMIDDRPIFSRMIDGTFWESLPVDINDVDRIEIIRGPSGLMYGPNAANGSINIITKRNVKKTMVLGEISYGLPSTLISNMSFGKKLNDKFDVLLSANYQRRDRFDIKYRTEDTYGRISNISSNWKDAYPDPALATEKWGTNVFVNYMPTEQVDFRMSAGFQDAIVQRHSLGSRSGTIFTTNEFNSYYANLDTKIYGLNLRGSIQAGTDDLNKATPPNMYDYSFTDVVAEYDFFASEKNFRITPGLSYQSQRFNDKAYVDEGATFLNGKARTLSNMSAYVRVDAHVTDNLRLVGGVRADQFSLPDEVYLAYEFASTLKVHKNYMIRAVMTGSHGTPSVAVNYLDWQYIDSGDFLRVFKGDSSPELLTNRLFEFGFRAKIHPMLQIDIDVFRQVESHFTEIQSDPPLQYTTWSFDSPPTRAIQKGVTLLLEFRPQENVQIKPFITLQETTTKKFPGGGGIDYFDRPNKSTPAHFGGYMVNVKAAPKLDINISGYFYSEERFDRKPKHLVNLKVMYALTRQWTVYVNGRNITNQSAMEYDAGDKIFALYNAGVSFKLR